MKIGIFGGSFNPVHNEHIKIAKSAVKELSLDKLFIMPTFISPHKKEEAQENSAHRLNMLNLAFEGDDIIEVSNYEVEKQGVSYTFETIKRFSSIYKGAEIFFLMGSDMLENFPTWKNPFIITELATLVLIERRNGEFDDEVIISAVEKKFGAKIIKLKVYGDNLSSTELRVRVKLNLPLDNLTPKSVEEYIKSNELYCGDKFYEYIKNTLPIKRREHTAGVILTSIKLAKKLGIDVKKAELSALLHDLAKYKNYKDYKEFSLPNDVNEDIIHQFLGEYIARVELGIKDSEVLNAIKYHTTGRSGMTLLEKITYVADLIEPSRKFEGVIELRREIDKDFNNGFYICLKEIVDFLSKNDKEIYSLTLDALKELENGK